MDKKNIIIIILSILLVIASGVLIVKIYNRYADDKNIIISNGDYNVFPLENCVKGKCDKTFLFSDNEIKIHKESSGSYEITYNDYVIYASADKPFLGDAIYTFEDSLLFSVQDEDGNLKIMKYQMGNFEAEEISIGVDDYWYIKSISAEDDTITIQGSRFLKDNQFLDIQNEATVEINECHLFQEFSEREAEAVYQIRYKDGAFQNAELISTSLLGDNKKYSSLCQ